MYEFTNIIIDESASAPAHVKTTPSEDFAYGSFTASDGTVLPYRYYLPDGYETSGKDYPVLLYLHGNGSRGTNNTSQLSAYSINTAIYNSDYDCIMIAPQCPGSPYEWTLYSTVGNVNHYPGSAKHVEFLESGAPYGSKYFCAATELLGSFLTDYRVDTSRVYLAGSSNGTGAVWNLLSLYPEVFAGAIPVAGCRAEPDYVHSVAHRMKNVAIWAFHGEADNDSGSPVEGTRTMAAALREIGGNITYTEVAGGNHSNIWKIAADTPGVVDWLFAQTNDSFVNTLSGVKGPALSAPANPRWYRNSAAWDAVSGAGAYKVTLYVDGREAKTVFTPYSFYTPDLSTLGEGEVTFTVRAYPQTNANAIGGVSAASAPFDPDAVDDAPTDLYVRAGATGLGLSAESPMGSLTDAFSMLENGGAIHVIGDLTLSEVEFPEIGGNITVSGGSLTLRGNITFAKNTNANVITLDLPVTASAGATIFGGFNSIVFGESFAVTGSLDFYGGVDALPGTQGEHEANFALNQTMVTALPYAITVKNGTFGTFAGGNRRAYNDTSDSAYAGYSDLVGSVAAPLTVTVDGGIFNGTFSLSGHSILADDATLTVNGGIFNGPVYAQANFGAVSGYASFCTRFVMADRTYFANDGDITLTINGGVFNGGVIGAHEIDVTYNQCLRGDFTLTIGAGATFAAGTLLDATQVKAYAGQDKIAALNCPDESVFTVLRFDRVNGQARTYDEPLRVTFIGDSITQGTGSSDQRTKSYSKRFAELCAAAGREVIVSNYGVGGSTILDYGNSYYNRTLAYSIAYYEADAEYIVIALGTNDASYAGGTVGQMLNFTEKYETFVKSLGDLADTEKVFTTSAIYRLTSQKAADVRAVSVVRPTQKYVTETLAKTSDKYIYVDLYALLYDAAVTDTLFGGDKLHPNDSGYVIYGQAIYDAIFGGVYTVENFGMRDVYLSAGGRLAGAGTVGDPMSSLPCALGRLAPTGTLHIVGEYTYPAKIVTPRFMEKLTLVGEGTGAKLYLEGDTLSLLSDTELDNFDLDTSASSAAYLVGNWNNLEITESFTSNTKYRFLAGQLLYYNDISKGAYDSPQSASSDKDITVTVNGGTFNLFVGGNWRISADGPFGTYSGNMTLNIGSGATIKSNGYNGVGGQNYLSGTVTANIDSWPSGQLCRDYPRIGSQSAVNVFNEVYNTGTTVMHFGEGVVATPILTGDLNGDGRVTLLDALRLLRYAVDQRNNTSEIHNFYSFKTVSLVNVLRAFKKLL
ncbi:MAG: hypothetical protein IJU41_07240 [Clostridia bacterium]|nr:hypothetical protein [Clostridia bacterium]